MEHIGIWLLVIYLILINLFAVAITISDKQKAKGGKWRVPEKTLLLVAALGGSIAMLATMFKIRHKTKHPKFMIGIPAIIVAQVILVVLAIVLF